MSIDKIEAGTIVAKKETPDSLVIFDKKIKENLFMVINPDSSMEFCSIFHKFNKKDMNSIFLMFCCVSLMEVNEGELYDNLKNAIGNNFNNLEGKNIFMAKAILMSNEYNSDLNHRCLASFYKKCIKLCQEIVFSEEEKIKKEMENEKEKLLSLIDDDMTEDERENIEKEINSINIKDNTDKKSFLEKYSNEELVPNESFPLRDEPESTKKNRGHLLPGRLPSQKKRDFYCGIFDCSTGNIIDTKTYEETGYNTFDLKVIWKAEDLQKIKEGEYAFFKIYDNGKTYVEFPFLRNDSIYPSVYRNLKKQFEVNGEEKSIYIIQKQIPGRPLYSIKGD